MAGLNSLAGDSAGTVGVWDVASLMNARLLNTHSQVNTVAVSADAQYIATAGPPTHISIWNVVSLDLVRHISVPAQVTCLCFCSDTLLLAGCSNGGVHCYDWRNETVVDSIGEGKAEISGLVVAFSGSFIHPILLAITI
jgi:WD40 repeat protein